MKRTTLILFVLFAVLGSGTAWYLWQKPQGEASKSTLNVEHMRFAVEKDAIHKVFIADREGNQSTVERRGDHWMYNGEHRVREAAISNLLLAMSTLKVKYRPSRESIDFITKWMATHGIKVEAYGKDGELLKSYYIGRDDEDGTATFMVMDGADEPFAMHRPGLNGSLRPSFFLIKDEWREKIVYRETPEDIVSVSVEYPMQRNKSFRLERDGEGFNVSPYYEITPRLNKPYRKGTADAFLQNFEKIQAEGFTNQHTFKDSLLTKIPFAVVSVKLKDGTEKTTRYIPFHGVNRYGKLVPPNFDEPILRYHVDCNWGDFMLVQHPFLKNVFVSYDHFFES